MTRIQLIAFDADDTLWHNETLYQETKQKAIRLLAGYALPEAIDRRLDEMEMRNLPYFGYGAKSFVLSIIETAIAISGGRVQAAEIGQIIQYGREMVTAETRVLEGVEATLKALFERVPLMVITKGDLLDQEAKLARSGLAGYFRHFETVSDKTVDSYRQILARLQTPATGFMMVGNALKSDILPVLQLGGYAVYVPYALTWAHEQAVEAPAASERFFELASLSGLPDLLARIEAGIP